MNAPLTLSVAEVAPTPYGSAPTGSSSGAPAAPAGDPHPLRAPGRV